VLSAPSKDDILCIVCKDKSQLDLQAHASAPYLSYPAASWRPSSHNHRFHLSQSFGKLWTRLFQIENLAAYPRSPEFCTECIREPIKDTECIRALKA
jgi:hypothetical protein